MSDKGHSKEIKSLKATGQVGNLDDFVLEKGIFSNIFEKDIRRVYIYKKAERMAKAMHLIAPAFSNSPALRNRIDAIAVGLVDAAILPPTALREGLSRELLALSSMLSIAKAGGLLSHMNTELIGREAHALLDEISAYVEPRLFLDEAPTLASLFKEVRTTDSVRTPGGTRENDVREEQPRGSLKDTKGHISDNEPKKAGRRDAVLAVLRSRGPSFIKDISTVIRDVSEKTIQRELSALVSEGVVIKVGERRWTTYTLAE